MMMLVETRKQDERASLVLIPVTEAEADLIESVLGKHVQDVDGLIAAVCGEYRIADGYGPSYLSLTLESHDAQA